jgi:hypothetical protein
MFIRYYLKGSILTSRQQDHPPRQHELVKLSVHPVGTVSAGEIFEVAQVLHLLNRTPVEASVLLTRYEYPLAGGLADG